MTSSPDRRVLLQGATATATLAAFSAEAFAQPSRPYRVGVIGAGWFGKLDLWSLMQVAPVEVVALADVDQIMLENARDAVRARPDSVLRPRRAPRIYHDYREMLRNHQLDIVIVGTPDHWHTLPAIAALDAGAHVYIEKPVSVDVREGQALVAAARRANRVVQVGTQRRTAEPYLTAKQRVVDAGLLGKVGHVEIYCYYHQRPVRFSEPEAPPPNLDWDFYCGPAPLIPFRREMHIRDWRAFMEFGNGYMGDVGVHFIDLSRWMLGLGWPKRVSSTGGVYVDTGSAANVPDLQNATFEYDDLLMTWNNRHWGRAPNPREQWGAGLHGENGTLWIYNRGYEWTPNEGPNQGLQGEVADELADFPHDEQTYVDWERPLAAITRAHMRDFLRAIAANARPAADIEEGHLSTAMCVLANTSWKLGRPINWDGATQRVIGDDEADSALARPYRAPWRHPGVA